MQVSAPLKAPCCLCIRNGFKYLAGFNGFMVRILIVAWHKCSGCANGTIWYGCLHGYNISLVVPPIWYLHAIISGRCYSQIQPKILFSIQGWKWTCHNCHWNRHSQPSHFSQVMSVILLEMYRWGILAGISDTKCTNRGRHICWVISLRPVWNW